MLEISLLSPFALRLDGQPLKLPSRRTEALFVYLLRNPHPQAREVLAAILWDDLPQKKAMGNLRVLLANLRKQMQPYAIITRTTAAFNLESQYRTDLTTLEASLTVSRAEMEISTVLTRPTAHALADTLNAYRGDLLPGFHLRDGQGFEEWLAAEREWLWTRVVEALEDLTKTALHRGDFRIGIVQAQKLVHFDPLREEGHQQLMQLWAADGQISAALAQYERCVHILEQELDVPPHPYTTELYDQIRDGVWRLPDDMERTAVATRRGIDHNLPRQMTPLIGRGREMARLQELLQTSTTTLITLVGPGGIGKTALAIEAARAQLTADERLGRDRRADGVHLVRLGSVVDAANMPIEIAATIGFRFQKGHGDEPTQLLRYLSHRSLLLILDNMEHLLDESDLISEILMTAEQVQILATSRHRLNIHGEHVIPITGLSYPSHATARRRTSDQPSKEEPANYSAIQLFTELVIRSHGQVEFDEQDFHAIAEICRSLQGMPLAILLAAAWVDILSPAEIAAEIGRDLAFLTARTGKNSLHKDALPDRHQSVIATFNHSWNLLTPAEQQIFARLSIFRDGCSRPVAQRVSGGSLRDLLTLVNKSLLVREMSSGRLRIHGLLRQFAAAKLAEMSEAVPSIHQLAVDSVERLYGENVSPFYAELAFHAEMGEWPEKARNYYRLAGDDARDRFQNNLALDHYDHALQLTPTADQETVFALWLEREAIDHTLGRRDTQADELALLHAIAKTLQDGRKQSVVFVRQARYAEALGHYTDAADAARQAVGTASTAGDVALLARAHLAWGVALGRMSEFKAAEAHLQSAVDYAERAELPLVAADSLQNLGIDAAYQDQYALSQRYFEQNLQIYRDLGNRPSEAAGLGNLGALALRQGDWRSAQPYLEEAVAIFREIGDLRSETIGLNNLGVIAHRLANYAEAQRDFERALSTARLTGDQQSLREAHNLLGHLFSDMGEPKKARAFYEDALALAIGLDSSGHIIESTVALADIARIQDEPDQALHLLRDVLTDIDASSLRQTEDPVRICWRAYLVLTANQRAEAVAMLELAYDQIQQQAGQIVDETLRHTFLRSIAIHHAVLEAYAERRPNSG